MCFSLASEVIDAQCVLEKRPDRADPGMKLRVAKDAALAKSEGQ